MQKLASKNIHPLFMNIYVSLLHSQPSQSHEDGYMHRQKIDTMKIIEEENT